MSRRQDTPIARSRELYEAIGEIVIELARALDRYYKRFTEVNNVNIHWQAALDRTPAFCFCQNTAPGLMKMQLFLNPPTSTAMIGTNGVGCF